MLYRIMWLYGRWNATSFTIADAIAIVADGSILTLDVEQNLLNSIEGGMLRVWQVEYVADGICQCSY